MRQPETPAIPMISTMDSKAAPSAATPISELIKPWMSLANGALATGYGGHFGVQRVWDEGIRGQGVKVGVHDTGLVEGHAEFDYAKIERDGVLSAKDQRLGEHGTAVSGLIAARANGRGVVGVANECDLWVERLPTEHLSYKKLSFVKNAAEAGCDVLNNSALVDFSDEANLHKYVHKELDKAARGREGLGMSLVTGAGNERALGFDTALQPSTNHENVITVAAVNRYTSVSDYSTPGESIHVAAPGDDVILANAGDLTGTDLKIASGTSYAAPFVSGVVALMYQANPGLGLRDVQAILAQSASLPLGELSEAFQFNGGRHANGGGLHFSRDFGFGLVNAHKAVRLAESWFVGGFQAETALNRQKITLNTLKKTGIGQSVTMTFRQTQAGDVEHVKLRLGLDVKDINDLRVVLTSPQGTQSVLIDNFGKESRAFNKLLDLASRRFWGEDAVGEWSVSVSSRRSLKRLWGGSLTLSGGAATPDDRYVYSDEFNVLAAADPSRLLLEDDDGGHNTFNAACVTSDTEIDLRAGKFRLGEGPEGKIAAGTVIETVIGGDAHDRIVGQDHVVNTLQGGRGNDTISGGVGKDCMAGGLGDDLYSVDSHQDEVIEKAGEGRDAIQSSIDLCLPEHVEVLVLNSTAARRGVGNSLDNLIRGNSGNNILCGAGGNDVMEGGAGDDRLHNESGTALFNGGAGNDLFCGSAKAEIYLGDGGNDVISTGAGDDIILFNRGDGRDCVRSERLGSKTLSLGGDFAYSDLSLSKSGRDLVLSLGAGDQISFLDWYAAKPVRPVVNLQVIAEALRGFDAGGRDPLLDQKVESFDFAGLVGAFDAARTATPKLRSWSLMPVLSDFHLAGSDSEAVGGDLAYQYGRHGTLAGIGLAAAQAIIGDSAFGAQTQTLQPFSALQSGSMRLS
jgi:Ca2+-binding RTX toxin-like protein